MIQLSIKEARKIAVQSQKIAGPVNRLGIKQNTLDVLSQIGYVQIDTISVVERAHHHKLWTRVEGYDPNILSILEKKKKLFEYWSHAASYLPIDSYRFTLPIKKQIGNLKKFWHQKDPKQMERVLDRVRLEGPLMSREFEEKSEKPVSGWPVWGPSKRALHHLFMEGKLMIVGRKGFQKIYDLSERWLPEEVDTSLPTQQEYIQYLINRDLIAHGLIKLNEIGYLLKGIRQEVKSALDVKIIAGEIIGVNVKGLKDEPYYLYPESLRLLEVKGYRKRLKILSPFDNLIINRKRSNELFAFDYLLECYVPQPKRKFGYFALPILWGDELIGQMDVKAKRKDNLLQIRNLEFKPGFMKYDQIAQPLTYELGRMMHFNSCKELSIDCKSNEFVKRVRLNELT